MAYWWKYNLNSSIYKNGCFIYHLNVRHGFFIFFLATVIIAYQLISSQYVSKNYSKNRNWNSCLTIIKLNIVLLSKYFLWLMTWCSRFRLKKFLVCYPCVVTFLYRGPRVLRSKSDRRFSSNSFKIFTWKKCLLDKLNDSTKFQANPGSELKSQNTWRVWLVLSIILYNPDLSTPAAL